MTDSEPVVLPLLLDCNVEDQWFLIDSSAKNKDFSYPYFWGFGVKDNLVVWIDGASKDEYPEYFDNRQLRNHTSTYQDKYINQFDSPTKELIRRAIKLKLGVEPFVVPEPPDPDSYLYLDI